MFAESIVDSITGLVISLISQEIGLACGVKGELVKLQSTVSAIGALLHEADRRQILSQDVKDWIGKLKDVVYDADDLLDDFSSEGLLRWRVMGRGERVSNEVRTFCSSSNQILYAFKMAHRVKDIRERIDAIADDRVRFQLEGNTNTALGSLVENRVRPETYPFESKPYVIGRDEDKKEVIEFLLNPHFEENVSILPIVGLGGMGKTTFARLVFNDESVEGYFERKFWVCVSNNFNVEDILRKIVQEYTQGVHMNELREKLGEEVDGKRFLLVLDDVWNENRAKWLELEGLLRNGAKGSKILVTTRTERVARMMATTHHGLSGLPEQESLTLLMRMAMKQEHEWRGTELEVIAKEIVKKCVGVPLAIVTIGRLLVHTRNREDEWLTVKNIDLSRSAKNETDIIPTLRQSYNVQPYYLKQCFAFCSLFLKDSELKPSELIGLWMAQGFIKSTGDGRTLEEIGHDYFMELASRSFFLELEEDSTGIVRGCKMHDLMHDLACSVAGDECATVSYQRVREIPEGARHVSVVDIDDSVSLQGFEMNRKIRSLFFIPVNHNIIKISRLHVSRFRNLRALRLQGIQIKALRGTIGKLKLLRCLDLSQNRELTSLPKSIGSLFKLQTLNLRGCSNLKELPRGITKLVSLRLLDVYGCDKLLCMPRGIEKLTHLQMLGKFVVGEKKNSRAARLTELSRLTELKNDLIIEHLERSGSISSEVDASFSMKEHALQSLELQWKHVDQEKYEANNNEEVLKQLQPHQNLKGLVIKGYGGIKLSSWVSQLHRLVKIEISCCNECIHLPPLDHLSSLKVISLKELRELEWIELSESWKLEQPLFPCLEVLELKHLPNFRGWERRRSCGNIDIIEERETQEEENIQGEKEEEDPPLFMLSAYPHNVAVTIEYCPRFSYIQGQQLHLGKTTNKILQQLLSNTTPAPLGPSMMKFINVPSISLSKLTSLSLCGMKDTKHLPMELFQSLPSLQSLVISCCPRLKSLCVREIFQYLTELERLEIRDLASLDLSNDDNDGDGGGEGMHDLQQHGHSGLRHLMIKGIFKMESLPGWMLYLPNLEALEISSCFNLKSLPGRFLQFVTSLKTLVLRFCPELDFTGQPENHDLQQHGHSGLRHLMIEGIFKMESLPGWMLYLPNLEALEISSCFNLKSLPGRFLQLVTSLETLKLRFCPELDLTGQLVNHDLQQHGHTRLRHIMIEGIFKMESLPGWMLYLPNLEALEISSCFNLKSLPGRFLQLVTSLETLKLRFCPELNLTGQPENQEESLNLQSGSPTKLRELELGEIVKMKTLPWWIQHLTNLERLKLFGCCNLEALPEWFPQLTSLKSFTVVDCKELSRRCKRNIGEDWPKISYIQDVHIPDDNK